MMTNGMRKAPVDVNSSIGQEQLHWPVRVEANLPVTSAAYAFFLQQMHNKKIFDFENEGQGREVQHSQWRHSMANINLCKSSDAFFYDNSYRFRDINVSNLLT